MERMPKMMDDVELNTWIQAAERASCERDFSFVADGEQISRKEGPLYGSVVRKLILHHLTISQPAHNDTRQEGTCRQHQLCREEVAGIHQRQSEDLQISIGAHREGTEHSDDRTDHRKNPSGTLTR